MNILQGASSWKDLRKDYDEAANGAPVTVTAGGTEVVAISGLSVAVGDILFVNATMIMSKGLVTGRSEAVIGKKAGAATIKFISVLTNANLDEDPHDASTTWSFVGTFMFTVTAAGDLDVNLFAASAGSNGTVALGGAGLATTVIRGS